MCSTLALVAGMAQPAACAAPPARDARAPLSRFSHARPVCFYRRARSQVGASRRVHGRAAGESALGIRLRMAAEADLASRGRCIGQWGRDGGPPLSLEITRQRRHAPGGKEISTLPQAPFGRILIFFSDFCSVEKRVTRSREWYHLLGVNRTSQTHQNTTYRGADRTRPG